MEDFLELVCFFGLIFFAVRSWYFKIDSENLGNEKKHLENEISKLKQSLYEYNKLKSEYEKLQCAITKDVDSMPWLAGMITDLQCESLKQHEDYFNFKSRPSYKSADIVSELKQKVNVELKELKIYQYQIAYLKKVLPFTNEILESKFSDIKEYIKEKEKDKETLLENYDEVKKYISADEYKELNETNRNQLALDRYIERRKSKWQIGRDYELFIGHEYEKEGWNVEYYGTLKGFEDLGRDLICKKGNSIHIVQCKNWSKHKEIHENAINQLYGTMIEYCITNNKTLKDVKGVFVTTTVLSETAQKFAELLNIKVRENKELGNFPRIKCNIGKDGEKIYHLPMDQQYDKIKIDKEGELWAYTVEEAENKGFRRAFKYYYNKENQ